MAKVASVKLGWKKSPSPDVVKTQVVVNLAGSETTVDLAAGVEEYVLDVAASTTGSFKVVSWDDEGNQTASETHSFKIGDLEAPLPATDLFHEVLSVRDVPDNPTP